jgi:hypothetical protein
MRHLGCKARAGVHDHTLHMLADARRFRSRLG